MGVSFNPLTGQIDITGSAITTVEAPKVPYSQTVGLSNWTLGLDRNTLTIPASTHGKGTTPSIQCFEYNEYGYLLIYPDVYMNDAGDVTISIQNVITPFIGKVVINN